jgi:hypothetical protein
MPFPEEKRNTNGFDKRKEDINRSGAPRKMVSTVIKELSEKGIERVAPVQIVSLFESLLNLTKEELAEMMNDEKQPMINRIVARNMLEKKGFEIIEKILDRVHGKAVQKIEEKTEITLSEKLQNIQKITFISD